MPRWKPTRSRSTPSSQGGECPQQGSVMPTLQRGAWLCWLCLNHSAQIPSLEGAVEMEFCWFPVQSYPLLAKLLKRRQLGRCPRNLLLVFALAVTTDTANGLWLSPQTLPVGSGQGEQGTGCQLHPLPAVPPNQRQCLAAEGLHTLWEPEEFLKIDLSDTMEL